MNNKYTYIFFSILTVLFIFIGCNDNIPSDKLAEAKIELSKAEAVDAEKYSITNYNKASDFLILAIKSVRTNKTKDAIKNSDESIKYSKLAYIESLKKKTELEMSNIAGIDKKIIKIRGDYYFKDLYKTFKTDEKEVKNLYTKKDYLNAYEKARKTYLNGQNIVNNVEMLKEEVIKKIDDATIAIQDAENGRAKEFAKDLLNEAKSLLKEAKNFFKNNNFETAKTKAQEAYDKAVAAKDKAFKKIQDILRKKVIAFFKEVDNYYSKSKAFIKKYNNDKSVKQDEKDDANKLFDEIKSNYDSAKDALNKDKFDQANNFGKEVIRLSKVLLQKSTVKYYTVQLVPKKRDCLWRIAEKKFIFSNPYKWPKIWKANKDIISDPDLIYPGQKLKITE